MANNRMFLVCNTCVPNKGEWGINDPNIIMIGKWYPIGPYNYIQDEALGKRINDFMYDHTHADTTSTEYPIRLEYEVEQKTQEP